MFGSWCNHCDWLVAGCVVFDDGAPVLDDNGKPVWRILIARPEDYEILDTWYTTGLRGIGSNDYRCEDLFVPAERTFSLLDPPKREGAIWARLDHLMRKMWGVPLGVAVNALETARDLLSDKTDRWTGVRSRDIPRVQSAVAQAHGMLAAARSYVFTFLEAQWKKLERGEPLTVEERAGSWLSRTHAFQTGRDVVSLLYDTIWASAIYSEKSPFDRHLRDLHRLSAPRQSDQRFGRHRAAVARRRAGLPRRPVIWRKSTRSSSRRARSCAMGRWCRAWHNSSAVSRSRPF